MVGDTVDPPPMRSIKTEIVFQDGVVSVQKITNRVREKKHVSYRVLASRGVDIDRMSPDSVEKSFNVSPSPAGVTPVTVQQTINIQPGIPELIAAKIREAAPVIAKSAKDFVLADIERGGKAARVVAARSMAEKPARTREEGMMKVTMKEKPPEQVRLEQLQEGTAQAAALVHGWLEQRDFFVFTNDDGSPATADDILKEVYRQLTTALAESRKGEGLGVKLPPDWAWPFTFSK